MTTIHESVLDLEKVVERLTKCKSTSAEAAQVLLAQTELLKTISKAADGFREQIERMRGPRPSDDLKAACLRAYVRAGDEKPSEAALHEAAHCVVAIRSGLHVELVEISHIGNGRCLIETPDRIVARRGCSRKEAAELRGVAVVAGGEMASGASASDLRGARMSWLFADDANRVEGTPLSSWQAKARSLIKKYRREIDYLATILQNSLADDKGVKRLSSREIVEVLGEVPKPIAKKRPRRRT